MALLKALVPAEDAFITTTAPASLEVYRENEFYKNARNLSSPSPRRCASNTR